MIGPRWIVSLLVFALASPALADALPEAQPAEVGFDPARLATIEEAVREAIDSKAVPGAVVLVGRHGKLAYARASGDRALQPESEAMTRDTIFDMASLTKPLATATSVLILIDRGKIDLDEPFTTYLPEFANHGKEAITVEMLLRHRGGLIPDNPLSDFADGPDAAWEHLANLDLIAEPGAEFHYSDVSFMILGRLVERVSGKPLETFALENIFQPLGMDDTRFRPIRDALPPADRIAPTERDENGSMLRGVVHDPRSRAIGGVAGHAGLFSTADDVAVFTQMILNGGVGPNGARILKTETVQAMIDPGSTPPRQRRGLGWDIATGYSSPRGHGFGPISFGHTGFTGTSVWIDPETHTFVVILASRLHPDGKAPSPTRLRSQVATIVAEAITDPPTVRPVKCGVDMLIERDFEPLRGKKIGLVTNQTGRARDGRSTIDVLFHAPDVHLVALFSPEHGIRGVVDREVSDSVDEATGLPIFSLYGATRKPTPDSLKDVEILVYDIQDIGARFYTYISTLGLVLEAARERGVPLVVLDRPNPIGGEEVEGPVRDADFESFIAYHPLPVRHGMTVGELAGLFNTERQIGAELTVVPCVGWLRRDLFDRTGLLWVNPSPNMRSLTEAILYPGVCLLEASNVATGRGTDTPFERVGAPWIDPTAFSNALNDLRLPGTRFVPIRFTPTERQYANESCGGVYIIVTDRERFEPIGLGLGMAVVLRRLYPNDWKPEGFLRMLADRDAYQALLDGRDVEAIRSVWSEELAEFRRLRERYLLYP